MTDKKTVLCSDAGIVFFLSLFHCRLKYARIQYRNIKKKFGSKLPNLPLLTQQVRQERGNDGD